MTIYDDDYISKEKIEEKKGGKRNGEKKAIIIIISSPLSVRMFLFYVGINLSFLCAQQMLKDYIFLLKKSLLAWFSYIILLCKSSIVDGSISCGCQIVYSEGLH